MRLRNTPFVIASLLAILSLAACTKETIIKEKAINVEAKQAPLNMLETFAPSASNCESCITIQKDSLGKIFLLIASGKTSGATPQWYDLKPLVVSFEKSGNRLAILGQNFTSIYSEIQTVNLIQTFEVVAEDAKTITFNWGQGLKTFILQSSYDVDAVRGKNNNLVESSFTSLPVIDSFVRNIKYDEKNIELEQIAKINSGVIKASSEKSMDIENREETLAMNIQIRAYNLSSSFLKKEYDKSRRVGFFVTKISKEGFSTEPVNLITKWDTSLEKGPITVRISSSVPALYLDAVKEAALYWNHVFGKEIIAVKTGVNPAEGPQDRSIMIRWIPWLDAGAAYAIGQSDPLTGELLRAQVFMPSVFTKVGSTDLVDLNGDSPVVGGAIACDLKPTLAALQTISNEASDSQRLRLARDSVRATVAHEIGHALGMRHNFAGSYSAKVTAQEIEAAAKTYLKDPNHPGLETSTSIMDYTSGIDNILMAARLKVAPLAYDKMAMDWAYSADDKALDHKISKYCTDDDISVAGVNGMQIYGCDRFDSGNNPMLQEVLAQQSERKNFVKILFASILGRLYPADAPTVVNNIDTVLADSLKFGKINVEPLKFVGKFLFETRKNNDLTGSFASLDSIKSGQVLVSKMGTDAGLQYERMRSLKMAGGYAAMLNALLRNPDGSIATNWLVDQIQELKNAPYFVSGKTLGGREYVLTNDQQVKIIGFFSSLVPLNAKALHAGMRVLLPKEEHLSNAEGKLDVVTTVLAKGLLKETEAADLAQIYLDLLQAQVGTSQVKVGEKQNEVTVPKPFLNSLERATWAALLSSKGLSFDMHLKKALVRQHQFDKITAFVKLADPLADLNAAEPEVVAKALSDKGWLDSGAYTWLKNEIDVLKAIDGVL